MRMSHAARAGALWVGEISLGLPAAMPDGVGQSTLLCIFIQRGGNV